MENVLIKNENGYIGENTVIKDYFESLSQKQIERMYFDDFLIDAINWGSDVIIIRGEFWDEFYSTDNEDYEMKLEYTDGIKFHEKFKEITGIGLEEFEECFVSAKYIDEETENSMNLIIKVVGTNQRFVIDKM